MAHFKDLERCNCLPIPSEQLLAVGWLSRDSEFLRGKVSTEFFEKLTKMCVEPWQPVVSLGLHACDLCQFNGALFSINVFVPFDGFIYVAPVAITHYIAVHWYKPPEVFVQAVLECPPMNSMAYKKAILSCGGRELVRAVST